MSDESISDDRAATALRHLTGCPREGGEIGDRIERFTIADTEGRPCTVVRCIECGEQVATPVTVGARS